MLSSGITIEFLKTHQKAKKNDDLENIRRGTRPPRGITHLIASIVPRLKSSN
jgi:hypothetical protein